MRRVRKLSFEELVQENKRQLLSDKEALEKLEERWEQRIQKENGAAL
ncbi:FbpB family small basic protein [Alkalihalobacterium elongatum]|nr:FbpB family small basic protein [Alkalihalobacterium elongatum]